MSASTTSQQKFSDDLFQYILSRVVGTNVEDEITDLPPSKRFIVGSLAARIAGKSSELEEGKASIRASRMKVSFLINKSSMNNDSKLEIIASGNVYYPVDMPTTNKNEETIPDNEESEDSPGERVIGTAWRRLPFSDNFKAKIYGSMEKPRSYKLDFSEIVKAANQNINRIREIEANFWDADIEIETENFDTHNDLITISFTNNTVQLTDLPRNKKDKSLRLLEPTLFDCKLNVTITGVITSKFMDEYNYENHLQRYYYYFRTINCQANWESEGKTFYTNHYAEYMQNNIAPRNTVNNLDLSFSNLASERDALELLDNLMSTLEGFEKEYKENCSRERSLENGSFQPIFNDKQSTWAEREMLIDQFHNLLHRMRRGIEELRNDKGTMVSFIHMNETFERYYHNKGISTGKWRLFQLVFILATIPSIVKEDLLDVTDILHVNTGGGKSEAYFGLVVFAMFYERFAGKQTGVTALVKFPLRMLSIQQLERISSIVVYAEKVRSENQEIFGGSEFSIGYFVGDNEDFPNKYSDLRNKLYIDKTLSLKSPPPESTILSRCPLCDASNRGIVRLVEESETSHRIVHKCDNCKSIFYIYLTDKEIYRWRPSVIVSTVDKWAALSVQRLGRNLIGGKGSMCSHGFISSGDVCEDDEEAFRCPNVGNNDVSVSGPILSIQDEMHLLSEGFGTIASHFEGLVEALVTDTSNRRLKHVTMSATLNGSDRQVNQLYNKSAFVIPGLCPEKTGSRLDPFFEMRDGAKRIIYGLKPNLRDNHYAALRTILHFCEFMLKKQHELNNEPDKFCAEYSLADKNDGQNLIKQFIVPITYHIKKQDALDMEKFEQEVIVDDLNRTTFLHREDLGRNCHGSTLTGDSNLETLRDAMNSIRQYVKEYDPYSDEKKAFILKPIYATSVISHGVDLDELNFMVFQGLPYSTSEYIQALSRVGRKNLGMIILWFYPNRVRDDSFFRNFKRYHDTLDHQVRPIPISRLSKLGLHQTINSMFCAAVINYMSNKIGTPIIWKKQIRNMSLTDRQEVVKFIRQCYTGSDSRGALAIDVAREVENRINEIRDREGFRDKEFFPNILKGSGNYFYQTQSGMRGIQKELILRLIPEDTTLVGR